MKCKICGSELKRWMTVREELLPGEKRVFQILKCQKCGCGFTYPPRRAEESALYYPKEYLPYQKGKGLRNLLADLSCRNDIRIIKRLAGAGKLYEFGAGNGNFLACAKKAGFDVAGSDMAEEAVKNTYREHGIKLSLGDGESVCFQERYDVVVLRHVLEHLEGFQAVIGNIVQRGLKQNGVLYLKVPRFDSMEFRIFGRYFRGLDLPRHRNHFTEEGLRHVLREQGLKEIKIYGEENPIDYLESCRRVFREGGTAVRVLCILGGPMFFLLYFICFSRPGRMTVVALKK